MNLHYGPLKYFQNLSLTMLLHKFLSIPKQNEIWSHDLCPLRLYLLELWPVDINQYYNIVYPNKQLSKCELCLPAVPHRSTLSVCSKGLVLYWDSLVVRRQQKSKRERERERERDTEREKEREREREKLKIVVSCWNLLYFSHPSPHKYNNSLKRFSVKP